MRIQDIQELENFLKISRILCFRDILGNFKHIQES